MIAAMYAETLLPGMVVIEHTFDVPLDHGDPAGERITVFGRFSSTSRAVPDSRPFAPPAARTRPPGSNAH
jgi:hypothetical protein